MVQEQTIIAETLAYFLKLGRPAICFQFPFLKRDP
jgi:hypothetical protein